MDIVLLVSFCFLIYLLAVHGEITAMRLGIDERRPLHLIWYGLWDVLDVCYQKLMYLKVKLEQLMRKYRR